MFKKLTNKTILKALGSIALPQTMQSASTQTLADLGPHITINQGEVWITFEIHADHAAPMEALRAACDDTVKSLNGVKSVRTLLTAHNPASSKSTHTPTAPKPVKQHTPAKAPPKPEALQGVRHIIAIASGKGGVGKTTTSVNLACALKAQGLSVGLMDCDIYGPSLHHVLGDGNPPTQNKDRILTPVTRHGIKTISMGHLIPDGGATVWRGPKVMGAVKQLLTGVKWDVDGPLDVLLIDLPPGTGDAHLTLVQTVTLSGAIIVSTPQDIALIDAHKAYNMFEKTETPVLGLIENMSGFACPHCGEHTDIFGAHGAKDAAAQYGIEFLGAIPLHLDIRTTTDSGTPITISHADSPQAAPYFKIAKAIVPHLT